MPPYLSYSRQDTPDFAKRLSSWLRLLGYEPWLDLEHDITPDTPFNATIEAAIKKSDFVLTLLSEDSIRPDSICRDELTCAKDHKIAILAVKIAKVSLPVAITSENCLNASNDPGSIFYLLPGILDKVVKEKKRDPTTPPIPRWWEKVPGIPFHEYLKRYSTRFTGREWFITQLNTWASEPDSRLLLLTGQPGIGKSHLAARLALHIDVRGIYFFTPSDPDSCKPESLISVLASQFANQFPPYREILDKIPQPDTPVPPEELFRMLITDPLLACRTKLGNGKLWIIVIDGLDEAAASGGPAMIDFLEESLQQFPPWCRVIVTTWPDQELLTRFRGKGIRQITLEASSVDNRADLAEYIRSRVRSGELSKRIVGRIERLAAGNFLYAVAVVDFLASSHPKYQRFSGEPGELPLTLTDQYQEMFKKRFPDPAVFKKEIAPLVACLAVTLVPIPETVLIAASGLDWRTGSRGIAALSQFLIRNDDRLGLFHPGLIQWLTWKKSPNPYAVRPVDGRRLLAKGLLQEVREGTGEVSNYTRYLLPFYLMDEKMFKELAEILRNPRYIEGIYTKDKEIFLSLWSMVENSTPLKIGKVYAPVVEKPSAYEPPMLEIVACTLHFTGHPDDAMTLFRELETTCRKAKDTRGIERSRYKQAVIFRSWGRLDEAMEIFAEIEASHRKHWDSVEAARCMGDRGTVLRLQGDLDGAMSLYKKQEAMCRRINDAAGMADSFGSQAIILRSWGQGGEAMKLLREQERIRREHNDTTGIAKSQGAQALLLLDSGELDEAMKYLMKEERVCRELGDQYGLANCSGNRGCLLLLNGDRNGALNLFSEQETICRDLKDLDGLATSLGNQGTILRLIDNLDGALKRFGEQEQICRQMKDAKSLAITFANQALVYHKQADHVQASSLANAALAIAHDQGYHFLEGRFRAIVEQVQSLTDS